MLGYTRRRRPPLVSREFMIRSSCRLVCETAVSLLGAQRYGLDRAGVSKHGFVCTSLHTCVSLQLSVRSILHATANYFILSVCSCL